jgi:hypothetical protein
MTGSAPSRRPWCAGPVAAAVLAALADQGRITQTGVKADE